MDLPKAVERRDARVVTLAETRVTSVLVEDKGADRCVVFEVLDEVAVRRRHVGAHGEQERLRVVVLVDDPEPGVERLEERALRRASARELTRLIAHAFINDAVARPPRQKRPHAVIKDVRVALLGGFRKDFRERVDDGVDRVERHRHVFRTARLRRASCAHHRDESFRTARLHGRRDQIKPLFVVDSVRDTYLSTGGDIKSMLRVILHPDTIEGAAEPKIKRPIHLVSSILRSAKADVPNDDNIFIFLLVLMGQAPFLWDPPNGYPDTLEAWSGSLLPRWQAAQWMFDGTLPTGVDLQTLLADNGAYNLGLTAPTMNKILTGWSMTDAEVQLLLEFYADLPDDDAFALEDAFGLATSLPAFQWY